jgi:outer membrane protein OmpA-like peptidoglycan-associated protein
LNNENIHQKRVIEGQRDALRKQADLLRRKPEVIRDTVYMNLNSKVFFNAGSAEITSKAAVRDLAAQLKTNTNYVVTGYASEEGATEYNQTLSENRAKNLMNMLVEYGVNPDNVTFVGKGETTQFSATDRSQNRVAVVETK